MDDLQHPDGIWTWKVDQRSESSALWLPYLREAKKIKGKNRWLLSYNGGEFEADLSRVDVVMLYGASGALPVEFLDDLNTNRVPLLVHRRNVDSPYLFLPFRARDSKDMLSAQVRARDNNIKRCYVARTLVRHRFQSAVPEVAIAEGSWRQLSALRSVKAIRLWEAQQAQRFWASYFSDIGMPGLARRESGTVQAALDACSFFLFGVMLRWVLLHRMSPTHGFLHEPTEYPSLIYDLLEPYRYLMERSVALCVKDAVAKGTDTNEPTFGKALSEASLSKLKDMLDETVHTLPTRQWVRRKNLLHGAVLALRSYMVGDMRRLVLPQEQAPVGGRPVKVAYRLPGGRIPLRNGGGPRASADP
jgi:CRISPR/Cas system-associated endonuclease Cas1